MSGDSRGFTYVQSYVCPSVTGLFPLADVLKVPPCYSLCQNIRFLRLNNIPLYEDIFEVLSSHFPSCACWQLLPFRNWTQALSSGSALWGIQTKADLEFFFPLRC